MCREWGPQCLGLRQASKTVQILAQFLFDNVDDVVDCDDADQQPITVEDRHDRHRLMLRYLAARTDDRPS